jgi:hypothetical protein
MLVYIANLSNNFAILAMLAVKQYMLNPTQGQTRVLVMMANLRLDFTYCVSIKAINVLFA